MENVASVVRIMAKRKVFYIDGGAGRVIAAIPALEKYARLHPKEDWGVVIAGWDALYWGHPILQERTYSADTKGLFNNFLKDSVIETPEPYRVSGYFTQKLSLAEAFDEELKDNTIVITADTIVWLPQTNHVLNKPENFDDAVRMLNLLSGKMHEVYTGVCLKSKHKTKRKKTKKKQRLK